MHYCIVLFHASLVGCCTLLARFQGTARLRVSNNVEDQRDSRVLKIANYFSKLSQKGS